MIRFCIFYAEATGEYDKKWEKSKRISPKNIVILK